MREMQALTIHENHKSSSAACVLLGGMWMPAQGAPHSPRVSAISTNQQVIIGLCYYVNQGPTYGIRWIISSNIEYLAPSHPFHVEFVEPFYLTVFYIFL